MTLHDMASFEAQVAEQMKAKEQEKPLAAPAVINRAAPEPRPAPREHYCDCTAERATFITNG